LTSDANPAHAAAGATYTYQRSGSTWTPQAPKIIGTTTTPYPMQGRAVALNGDGLVLAISGDWDGDGLGAVYAMDWEYPARRRRMA
jgi:hypothetical protein